MDDGKSLANAELSRSGLFEKRRTAKSIRREGEKGAIRGSFSKRTRKSAGKILGPPKHLS